MWGKPWAALALVLLMAAPAAAQTTWNPSDVSANITLSGGDLTATANSSTRGSVRSTTFYYTGKIYFEVHLNGVPSDVWAIGLSTAEYPIGAVGVDTQGDSIERFQCRTGGNYRRNAADISPCAGSAPANGDTLQVAADLDNNLIWIRKTSEAAGIWNGIAADPATGSGGTNLQVAGGIVPLYITFSGDQFTGTSSVTLNTGASAFSGTVPLGFSPWAAGGAGVPAGQTLWNPSDKSGLVSVLDLGLRADLTVAGINQQGGARATTSYRAGKVYWEIQRFSVGSLDWVGIANINQNLSSLGNPPLGTDYLLCGNGGIVSHNGSTVGTCPAITVGDTSYIALDVTAGKIWFSTSSAPGVWNAGGGANPATGAGGIAISIHTAPATCIFPLYYGAFVGGGTEPVQYINTGGSIPFRGSAPAGYTAWQSGVTGPCSPPLTKARPQIWIAQ